MAGELPRPRLKVTFIVRMEDVTSSILKGLDPSANNAVIIQQRSDSILVAAKDSHYGGYVRPFYYGNQYFYLLPKSSQTSGWWAFPSFSWRVRWGN